MLDRKEIQKMTRTEILADVKQMLEKDCAGADRIQDPLAAGKFLTAVGTMEEMHMLEDSSFYDYMQLFLAAAGVPGTSFRMRDTRDFRKYHRGFSLFSKEGKLTVTKALPGCGLKNGDRIEKINGLAPEIYYQRNAMLPAGTALTGEEDWGPFLNHAGVVLAAHRGEGAGEPERIQLKQFLLEQDKEKAEKRKQIVVEKKEEFQFYLSLPSFEEEEEIAAAAEELEALLRPLGLSADASPAPEGLSLDEIERTLTGSIPAKILILDLRGSSGGSLDTLLPLFPYLVSSPATLGEFFGEAYESTRYTERNCELLAEQMRPFLESPDPEIQSYARERLKEIQENRGKDWVCEPAEFYEEESAVSEIRPVFTDIYVLVDRETKGEAEWLAWRLKQEKRVKIFGEATKGWVNYGSPVTMDFGFGTSFTYPASRLSFGKEKQEIRVTPDFVMSAEEIAQRMGV